MRAKQQNLQQQMSILTYTLDNKQEIFHTVIIIIFFMFVYLKTINCLNSIDNKEKLTHWMKKT